MRVKIERIRKGQYLPRAKVILRNMCYLPQGKCDALVDDMSFRDLPVEIALRGPFAGGNWDVFNEIFVFAQVPQGVPGSAKHVIDTLDDWDNEDFDDDEADDEEDETAMLLFCIKTEARSGNKYEILVLATTKEIALENAVTDPAVVKSCEIVPGPFPNGTVLTTKLIGV